MRTILAGIMRSNAFIAIVLLLFASALRAQGVLHTLPQSIGTATMAADGSVTLRLSRTADGEPAEAVFSYDRVDPDYKKILDHVGGLAPGETKPVQPWPDK